MTAYALAPSAGMARPARIAHPARSAQANRRSPARARVYAVQTPAARARRKNLLRTALIVAALAVLAWIAPGAVAGNDVGEPVAFDTYTVAQGETLWSISSALTGPGEDVRDTMAEVQALNAMSDGNLQAGEQIAIPVAGGEA